ncbi:hypothetical protein [Blastopirellula retiformator]|nr:hypothetical protein [Blastopirellula retiformator]
MKTEVKYSSDLTNRQRQLIRQLLPEKSKGAGHFDQAWEAFSSPSLA